jgi:ParB family transcriptional regulator, chromosome partitioning protein
MSRGGVELDRTVDSIRVGVRLRSDLGDLDQLCNSIETLGLLQPITITPDGTLVCGARRLAAVKLLGWRTVKVWITGTISGRLAQVLAEHQENTIRKAFTPTEAATLYHELKALYAADAARRQQATRFGANGRPESGPPCERPMSGGRSAGKAMRQAARAITGRDSSYSLERVLEVQRLTEDATASHRLRALAARELAAIDADGKVNRHYVAVMAAASTERLVRIAEDPTQPAVVKQRAANELDDLDADQPPPELLRAARAAIARATAHAPTGTAAKGNGRRGSSGSRRAPARRYGVRAFLASLDEMDGWWEHYDPHEIAAKISEEQWQRFRAHMEGSSAFIQAVAATREKHEEK